MVRRPPHGARIVNNRWTKGDREYAHTLVGRSRQPLCLALGDEPRKRPSPMPDCNVIAAPRPPDVIRQPIRQFIKKGRQGLPLVAISVDYLLLPVWIISTTLPLVVSAIIGTIRVPVALPIILTLLASSVPIERPNR